MNFYAALIVSNNSFFRAIESQAFALSSLAQLGDIIEAQHHILRRNGNRRPVCRIEDIVALKHQNLCFDNSFIAQREVNSHLVTIEVGIKCGTSQGVQLNCLAFNQFRLESLNTETVQSRSTVKQDGVTFHDKFENVPNNGITTIHDLLRALYCLDNTALNQATNNKWFIEFSSH